MAATGMSEASKENVARAGFIAAMAAAMGPVGLVIAALSVGIDRAWNGDAGRDVSAERYRQARLDNRAWLEWDRQREAAWRQARRDWHKAGADPATRPAGPSAGERAGRAVRRTWARAAVAAQDFTRGCRDGWHAAKDVKAQGGTWRQVAQATPDHPDAEHLIWDQFTEPNPPDTAPADATTQPRPAADREPTDSPTSAPTSSQVPDQPNHKEPDMTAPAQTAPAGTGPQGDTHLDVAEKNLADTSTYLGSIDEALDRLNQERERLTRQVQQAQEHATSTGAPAATVQALDAAMAALKQTAEYTARFSTAVAATDEQVGAARTGLQPARDAKDSLDQAGARGRFVDSATGAA